MFAKLFENTIHGQILVMLDSNENEEPIMKFFCQPEGLGVCLAQSPPFEDTEEGWNIAKQIFKEETEQSAVAMLDITVFAALKDMEIVEVTHNKPSRMYH